MSGRLITGDALERRYDRTARRVAEPGGYSGHAARLSDMEELMDNGRSTITLLVMILLVLTWSACFIMHELTRLANAAEAILSTQTRF